MYFEIIEMSKVYNCFICSYQTKYSSNYNRHMISERHKERIKQLDRFPQFPSQIEGQTIKSDTTSNLVKSEIKDKNICKFCGEKYTRRDNLRRHEKICREKENARLRVHINLQTELLDTKSTLLFTKDQLLEVQKEAIGKKDEEIKNLMKISGKNENMSNFRFINSTYTDVPPLEDIKDINRIIRRNLDIQYIKNEDKKRSFKTRLAKELVFCFNKGILPGKIAGIVCGAYGDNVKSENRQFWVTDRARSKFIVRTRGKNGNAQWKADCDGKVVLKKIINPISRKIRSVLRRYLKNECDIEVAPGDYDEQERIMRETRHIMEILDLLKHGKLDKKILAHLIPMFIIEERKRKKRKKKRNKKLRNDK